MEKTPIIWLSAYATSYVVGYVILKLFFVEGDEENSWYKILTRIYQSILGPVIIVIAIIFLVVHICDAIKKHLPNVVIKPPKWL